MYRAPELDSRLIDEVRRLMDPLVLASASPNRLETLRQCGISVRACPQDTCEDYGPLSDPGQIVRHISRLKMDSYLSNIAHDEDTLAIALDTMVSFDGRMLGKPGSRQEAKEMLTSFSGRVQDVVTGYVLYVPLLGTFCSSDLSRVRFRRLGEDDVERYLDGGEWQGAAGGYRIQRNGWRLVESIEGSWSNVIGIPLESIVAALGGLGWRAGH